MRKYVIPMFLLITVVGFSLIYWLWPQNDKLPVLDTVNNFQIEEVHGEEYQLQNKKVKLVTFFYTHCPDICPLTMMDFKELQSKLKGEGIFGKEVELVAISLDPENDTPAVIREYATSFQADTTGWKWLRSTPTDTKKIAQSLQMQYEKLEGDFFSHSTTMYLIDQNNQVRALYDMAFSSKPIEKDKIIEDIRYLVQ